MKFFFVNFILILITLLSFIFSKFKPQKKALYFIAFKKNNNKIIDKRSSLYCNENNLKNSINFIRCFNLASVIELFFKYKRIIVINSLQYFFSEKTVKKFIKKIFLSNQIDNFFMIDDYRYLNVFLPVCSDAKVFSHGYMHGRISKNLLYQRSLFNNNFDNYYVWSNYFKKKILEINKTYTDKNIIVLDYYKNYFKIKNLTKHKKKNILFLQEDNIPKKYIIKIVDKLKKKSKDYNFYYKVRPNNTILEKEKIFFKNKNINVFEQTKLSKLIKEKKINFIFGMNSSFLYIASLNNLYPISVINKYMLKDFKKDQIVFILDFKKNLDKQFQNFLKNKKKLNSIKKKLWY